MSAYIAGLNAAVGTANAQRDEEQRRTNTQAARERLSPLENRLTRLLATIPVEIQREGLSLSSLQASLKGRRRGNCHPGELGAALRKIGFERQRCWHHPASEDGFRARWYPARSHQP